MKRLLQITALLTGLFAGAGQLQAQVWNTVGNGLPGNWQFYEIDMATTSSNDGIYVAYTYDENEWQNPPAVVKVKKWNGLSWISYPDIPSAEFSVIDIEVIGSTIYVVGNSWSSNIAFYSFNGSAWTPHSPPGGGYARTAGVVNNNLVVAGNFQAAGIQDIFSFDGTNYIGFPALPSTFVFIEDILEFNGELYISGADSALDLSAGLLKLNGGSWNEPVSIAQGITTNRELGKLFTFQGDLYVADRDFVPYIRKLVSDTLKDMGVLQHNLVDVAEYNGDMYLVGDSANGGLLNPRITRFDGTNLTPLFSTPTAVAGVEVFNSELYVFSKTTNVLNGTTYNHAFRYNQNHSILNGEAFLDINSDCFKNSGETHIPNIIIGLTGQQATASGINGQYSFGLAPGTYGFDTAYASSIAGKNLEMNCSLPTSISLGSNQTITQDIAFDNSVGVDMQTTITAYTAWGARFGFDHQYKIDVTNTGNSTMASATLNVDVPASLDIISSTPSASGGSGNSLTYDFLNLQPLETRSILLKIHVDTGQNNLGDTLTWYCYFDPVGGDADLSDNADTLIQEVIGAYDPNDKQASASEVLMGTEKVDFHIRFQNTGTDTAFKVIVVDTLDLSMPITRVIINSASHPYSLTVSNNILVWEFDNIMLPDSGTDYLGSQGYVRFSTGLNPALAVGDTVDNDAEIYFDYQSPVHTNHAKVAIIGSISVAERSAQPHLLHIYPNPARDEIHLKNDEKTPMDLHLIDGTGKHIDLIRVEPGTEVTYRINRLSPGMYYLRAERETFKLVITY